MDQSNRHWIENLRYSIEVFDKPHGSLVEVLARVHDLDLARAVYAVACHRARNLGPPAPPGTRHSEFALIHRPAAVTGPLPFRRADRGSRATTCGFDDGGREPLTPAMTIKVKTTPDVLKPKDHPMRATLIAAFVIVAGADVVFAQAAEFGQAEYVRSCAVCHGPTGKGNGPLVETLNTPPTDLTKLSEANNGVFPVSRIYEVIDGRSAIRAHGTRNMPVWGDTYTGQLRYPGSTLSQEAIEAIVRARILGLIEYISTLQGK